MFTTYLVAQGYRKRTNTCSISAAIIPDAGVGLPPQYSLGMISSLRGVQLLIIAWWLCGASFQRAAVAREAKQKFLSYYFVFPSAHLIEIFD